MGMDEDSFNNCTPLYFRHRLFGMRQAQYQEFKNQWEISRWMVATIISPHLQKPIAPNKLMSFPWEVVEPDDIVAKITQYADIFAKLTPPAEA
jgi:hypothetical protein